jgi:phage terminase small subunit
MAFLLSRRALCHVDRKAELTQFPRIDVGAPIHLETPHDLPKALRTIVDDLIASQKAGHFKRGDEILLESYAAAHLLGREAFEKIKQEGAVIDGKPSPWLTVLEKTGRALVSLSGRLRLFPQMRVSSRDAGKSSPGYRSPPWQQDE